MEPVRVQKMLIPLGVNLLLGVPGVVPLFLLWHAMANGPLATLGLTVAEPTENDGTFFWWLFAAVAFCIFGTAWGLINVWLRPRTPVPAFWYWPACVAASLAPFCLILL
jgi:hypothetical protein